MTKNNLSAFHWREQPSQIDWRAQTYRQSLQDPLRVNKPVDLGAHGRATNSEKAPR